MSERKKKLFDDVLKNGDSPNTRNPYVRLERLIIEEGEDSDLGPMSPLEFSSSPSSFNEVHRIFERDHKGNGRNFQQTEYFQQFEYLLTHRTLFSFVNFFLENAKGHRIDFTNILNDDDDDDDRSNDTGHSDATVVNGTVAVDGSCTHLTNDGNDSAGEEDMMGPLCNSMKKLTSMTEQQNYEQQMKTPSDVSTTSKLPMDACGRNASFRKSLVFDSSLTPNDDAASPASKSSDPDHIGASGGSGGSSSAGPKAKTSLTFNEPTVSISVRSFYGKPAAADTKRHNDLIQKIDAHEFGAAIAAISAKHKMKFKSKSKSHAKSKSKSLSQRMKASAAPSLWRFSGKAKFKRHHRSSLNKSLNKSLDKSKSKLNTSTKSAGDAADVDVENVPPAGAEFTSRIEQNLRLQKILKEQSGALTASREINWIGGGGGGSSNVGSKSTVQASTPNQSGFLHSDADDDDDVDEDSGNETHQAIPNQCTYEEVEVDVEAPTNRKFFKSSASNSAKKYRIMGRLSATMKRGGDLKFDPPPKRKKKRSSKGM